ncbi:MAG TPA: N-acetylmuramoyl-L-alanine amidase [Pseudomonadota bacterium]|nr:N-acetylmuramoyl-L-alanine amidase [Pseudomonadota bacterium]
MKTRLTLFSLFLVAACGNADPSPNQNPVIGESAVTSRQPSEIGQALQIAAAQFAIPQSVLQATAYAQTRLFFVPGQAGEASGDEPQFGIFALRSAAIRKGAQLAGISDHDAQTTVIGNVRAAAALLRSYADEAGIDRTDLAAWAGPIARLSALPTEQAQADFIHNVVYKTLREGLPPEIALGHGLSDAPHPDLVPQFAALVDDSLPYAGARYSGSVWKPAPSSNFTVGRSAAIDLLVIHTCSGGYSGCVGWLQTPYPTNPYKTSAHYVVKEDGTEIAALVDESNTAHHVGASWEGRPTNPRSVGIEHGGFSYQGTNKWTEGQVSASAKLSCDVVKRNRIPRDRNHIIGHYQPDPVNRADDPGRDFPWADYMNRISRCVGGSTAIVVDSNQANNDASGKIDTPSSSWTSSTNVAGYYGSGYYVAPTAAVSDAVYFSFYLTEAANREVFAWWTAASDRSTETPFVIFDAAGNKLATVKKNQQDNGSQWVSLGRYNFTVGWNQVAISRWATAGSVVVADAIKVE